MLALESILHCLALTTLIPSARAYNFDTLVPTLVPSGMGSDHGFGFAMTQHQFSDGRKVVLVSSPRLNGSDFFGNPVEEGGVFSCPFDNSQSCQVEPVFQTKDDSNPLAQVLFTLLSDDSRSYNGQLLGYSLRSFDNHVVACAPLYVSAIQILPIDGEDHAHATPTGRCVVLNNDLSDMTSDILQVTNVDLLGASLTVGGIDINIINKDIGGGVTERITIGSVFGGAQTGNKPGQVVVTSLSPESLGDANVTGSSQPRPAVTEDELLGYKIELGRFTEDVLQVASSAPRASRHRGQIRIFNVADDGTLSETLILTGPEPDGYFGYDFVAHSFSERGEYHSLVVGCPLCSNDRGALLVYVHTGNLLTPFLDEPVRIPSPDVSVPGRFGTAVAIIGDSDGDGFADIAVSAPYAGKRGVVYICRGFEGGLLPPSQAIPASPNTNVFGYTLSGGLDIDNNGYPDLTVGDLSGTVTTIRASPLVMVVMEFEDFQTSLDLMDDRKCSVSDDIILLCFEVSPCFYYEPVHNADVAEFAFQYHLTVDGGGQTSRAVLLSPRPDQTSYTVITESSVSENITISGAGSANRHCEGPFTFAVRADFAETTPIPVRLEVSESDSVPPLPDDSTTSVLGGPLTPVLQRYTVGNQQIATAITQDVEFGLNCGSGSSTTDCEPVYTISLSPSFDVDEPLLLAPGASFSYDLTIENMALDDGLSPILVLELGNGILLNGTVSNSVGAVTSCESSTSSRPECLLRNPLHSNSPLSLTLSFRFNTSAIPLTTPSLPISFSVVDGSTGNIATTVSIEVQLRAEASFGIGVIVSEEQYQATRHALTQNMRTIPLNETGPTVRFSVLVSNSRDRSNGTTIQTSTLVIHIPVAMKPDRNSNLQPLLVPYQFFTASNDITCSQYDIIAEDLLSPIQRPPSFLPPGSEGSTPLESLSLLRECEGQRGELGVRCGTIVCSVKDLEAGRPPSQVTVFAHLFSPSIIVRERFSVFAGINSTTNGLEITDTDSDFSSASFEVLPSVLEVSLECFQYWIIAVSVVAGLLALFILIGALALCGVFGRWYKRRGEEAIDGSSETVDGQPSRSRHTTPRTIPPLPGVTSGVVTSGGVRREEESEEEKVDLSKEGESEREREQPATEHAATAATDHSTEDTEDIDVPLEDFTFDPHIGVSEEGEETEI